MVGAGGFHSGVVFVVLESKTFTTHFAGIFIYLRRAEDKQGYPTMWAAMQPLPHHPLPVIIHDCVAPSLLFLIQSTGWRYKTYATYAVAESNVGERFLGSIVNIRCGELGHAVAVRNIVLMTADSLDRLLARMLLNGKRRFDNRQVSFGSRGTMRLTMLGKSALRLRTQAARD